MGTTPRLSPQTFFDLLIDTLDRFTKIGEYVILEEKGLPGEGHRPHYKENPVK